MGRLGVFNSVTLDGYFTDRNGDMSWAKDVALKQTKTRNFRNGNVLLTFERMA